MYWPSTCWNYWNVLSSFDGRNCEITMSSWWNFNKPCPELMMRVMIMPKTTTTTTGFGWFHPSLLHNLLRFIIFIINNNSKRPQPIKTLPKTVQAWMQVLKSCCGWRCSIFSNLSRLGDWGETGYKMWNVALISDEQILGSLCMNVYRKMNWYYSFSIAELIIVCEGSA